MNTKLQSCAAYGGLAFVVFATLGWWIIAGMLPPISPATDAAGVAAFYQTNTGTIRFGLVIGMVSTALTLPWVALLALHMRRTEGDFPILSITQAVSGAVTSIILLVPFVLWSVAAFRPERSPELIQLTNDFAWMLIVMTFGPFFVQIGSVGLAILLDKNSPSVFPRWIGYFNIWVAVIAVPGALITFFKSGPFAWNGIIAFWLPLLVFMAWYIVMFIGLRGAIKSSAS
ncbi:MAG: hypothetical protein AAF387_20360 [Pseudomonadota bacterium]